MIRWQRFDPEQAARWNALRWSVPCRHHHKNIGCVLREIEATGIVLGPDGTCGWFREIGDRFRFWFAENGRPIQPADVITERADTAFVWPDADGAFVITVVEGEQLLLRVSRNRVEQLHCLDWGEARDVARCTVGARPLIVVGERGIAFWRADIGYRRLGLPAGWTRLSGGRVLPDARLSVIWTSQRVAVLGTDGERVRVLADRAMSVDVNIEPVSVVGGRIAIELSDRRTLEECIGAEAALALAFDTQTSSRFPDLVIADAR